MSLLSTPIKGEIATQKNIFRLAATMYANTSDTYSTTETQLQMIICVFIEDNNRKKDYDEIALSLLSVYKYHISKDELIAIIKRNRDIFQSIKIDEREFFSLTDEAYSHANELQQNNIAFYITSFIQTNNIEDGNGCRDAIYKYLYELTTTNINSYRVLLYGKNEDSFTQSELSVDLEELSEKEIELVHDFLSWENDEKNIALGNIVYCCLEYCLLINGDSTNKLLSKSLKKRTIYLDTNIIFRALGINGVSRQKVITAFLDKCLQANINLIISWHTKQEFELTIQHYIAKIEQFPHGNIYLGAFESLSDYTIFSYYDDWRRNHKGLSLKYFTSSINSAYKAFVKKYGILDNKKIPYQIYDSEDFKTIRNSYSTSIQVKKRSIKDYYYDDYEGYTRSSSHDATLVHYIEVLRQSSDQTEEDIFFVSSDKGLRYWDMSRREIQYPVVIYPSQLFLILIKLCGRSQNDYDSFVSFINIRTKAHQLSPETANVILSGISSITEDICSQEGLVASIFEDDFQNIILHSNTDVELYEKVQQYSQNYLDEQLKKREAEIEEISRVSAQKDAEIQELRISHANATDFIKEQAASIAQKDNEIQKQTHNEELRREEITKFAEKKTAPFYIFKWFILPGVYVILCGLYVIFIALQFLYPNESWNVVPQVMESIGNTWFGQNVDAYPGVIDGAIFAVLGLGKFLIKNPMNKDARIADKTRCIEKYIEKNHLL